MEKALKKFMRVNNNRHPARVIVYRDGVGEKQLQAVSEVEITQIKNALKSLAGNQEEEAKEDIKLMYINVCKRINTRLMAQGELVD